VVERCPSANVERDVGDVDVGPVVREGQRVVEVLRRLGIDRERDLAAQVDPALQGRSWGVEWLE
jgi:hypothetical protein